jgi:hypothetical protein
LASPTVTVRPQGEQDVHRCRGLDLCIADTFLGIAARYGRAPPELSLDFSRQVTKTPVAEDDLRGLGQVTGR